MFRRQQHIGVLGQFPIRVLAIIAARTTANQRWLHHFVVLGYFETFNVTVFEVALPFLGVTVTVTLHDPVLTPLSDEPDTLQYFAELATTFSETFEVESTFNLAKAAIDFAVADLDVDTVGAEVEVEVALGVVVVVAEAGAFNFRLGFGAEKCFKLKFTRTPFASVVMPNVCGVSTGACPDVLTEILPVSAAVGSADK